MIDHHRENRSSEITSLLDEAYTCRINNLKRSLELSEKALAFSRELRDLPLIGKSLNLLSLFHMIMGDYALAIRLAEEAIAVFTTLNDERGIADAKYSMAGVYYKTDNFHLGLVNLIECLSIYRKFDDFHNQARVHKSVGTIYEYFGDQRNAIKSYEDAITAARVTGDLNLESNAYNPLSGIYLKRNEPERAFELIERSIAMKKASGDVRGLAFALYGRAKVNTHMGKFAEAERDFLEAIHVHDANGEKLGIGMAYYKLGALYIEMNDDERATEVLMRGVEYSERYNIVITRIKCNQLLYKIYKRQGNSVQALYYLENYVELKESVVNHQTLQVIENYELITRMKSMEQEARLQKEKAEIMEKKERAEQAARVRQEFLSTMSHEIRTPLNAVITITSLLRPKTDPEEIELMDSLKFASNNLLMIINDILDFTKLDTGKVTLEFHPCNFRLLLENIRRTYHNLAMEKGLRLSLIVEPGVAESYQLDETKFSQIVGNLVGNAIKYTDTGYVDIRVSKTGEGETDEIMISVKDTGTGIAAIHLEEIFDSFFQPRSITTRKQGGSGLGLAIVRKLVELFGSKVEVSSTLGEGSEFGFRLRLKRSEVPMEVPARRSLELKDKRVLLAEDNVINAMVARKLLSNWGIITEHAKDGVEAVKMSGEKRFDFILMDIHMPEMNGFDATANIRISDNMNKDTPIFALTADIVAELREEYVPYFSGFLLKPIQIDKLYEALTSVPN